MKKRVAPLKQRRRQSQQSNFQPNRIIFYDQQQKLQQKCRICSQPNNLIIVCDCDIKYHQKCLLNFIKLQMKKSLLKQSSFNHSVIKCPASNCQKQINFTYQQKNKYSCQYFCLKLQENYCNKYVVLLAVLLIILATFLLVTVYLFTMVQEQSIFILFCVFSVFSFIIAISIIIVFLMCFWKYFHIREIFLKSIIQKGRSSEGAHSSSSSDQNKIYDNISENFEIYVED